MIHFRHIIVNTLHKGGNKDDDDDDDDVNNNNNNLGGSSGRQKLSKISTEYNFNQKHLMNGAKRSTITNVSYSMQIPKTCPLTLEDRMNFLPPTELKPINNLGQVKVSQQTDAEKCN